MPKDQSDEPGTETLRIDKWLWYARFFKSRTTASKLCAAGRVRVNREVIAKAHHPVRVGDILTFPQSRLIRVVEVKAMGGHRGPAAEARGLYEDLTPPAPPRETTPRQAARERGAGRPTKADRRALDRLMENE
ncbi:MAG TPA: RNA-binding S4 domain-containing protein [Alphaproteobacteria bacterium]|nr:RNA-binding S4 domain-containing protein [Alphaproteobacteria bacterium]